MNPRPTIKDVAALAGVSRQTVSRVINNKPEVTAETRTRVLKSIETLGYHPSAAARSLVIGRTLTLGCISPNLIDYTFASLIHHAQAAARAQNYFILAGSAPAETDIEPLVEEMLKRQVDGFLVINPYADGRYRYFPPLVERGLPVVYLNVTAHNDHISSLRCDDYQGGYEATHYLIELGHTSIATIIGPPVEDSTPDRLSGFRAAINDAGLTTSSRYLVKGDWSATSGYQATRQLLSSGITFTAIFAHNDRMAIGAIKALGESGLRVPEDISIVGFDDIPLASYLNPPLTTMRLQIEATGQRAAEVLIETIKEPDREPERILLPAQFVERASCMSPRL